MKKNLLKFLFLSCFMIMGWQNAMAQGEEENPIDPVTVDVTAKLGWKMESVALNCSEPAYVEEKIGSSYIKLANVSLTEKDDPQLSQRYNMTLGSFTLNYDTITYINFYPTKIGTATVVLTVERNESEEVIATINFTVTDDNPSTVTISPANGSTEKVDISGGEPFTFFMTFEHNIKHDTSGNVLDKNGKRLVTDDGSTEYGSDLIEVYLDRYIDWAKEYNSAPALRQSAPIQKIKRESVLSAVVNADNPKMMEVTINVGYGTTSSARGTRESGPKQKAKLRSVASASICAKLAPGAIGFEDTSVESPECATTYTLLNVKEADPDPSTYGKLTIGKYGVSTYYAEDYSFEVKPSDNIKVYNVDLDRTNQENGVVMELMYGKVCGAFMVKGEPDTKFEFVKWSKEGDYVNELKDFKVAKAADIIYKSDTESEPKCYNYLFGRLDDDTPPTFHQLATNYTVPADRDYVVYLQTEKNLIPADGKSVKVTFRDGKDDNGTTAIFRVETDGTLVPADADDSSAAMYNLQGQRVSSSYKGIVIQKGKKRLN